ncbi:ABC transporter ATP-binding protein [Microcella daejeonensis]|uniref:ABC transporter ATP-binding protein n=1 Tax=Microcella daejeonensis TaxID=2994971 RepID=A0A9E8MLE6_9MICO|nr:ABC transporter ATP-binding protein [Microcella daejeonensis]WAB81763.1 ABC transporter ATP-binding protein [Microcella daejeonensis]
MTVTETIKTTGTVLEVKDLSVDFGVDRAWVPAAKNLTYSVAAGEVLAIVGESGSGKSASSMAILDLLPDNARITGSVKLGGRELRGLADAAMRKVRGKDIAVIFQEPMTALNPVYTVGFQIVETLRLHFGITPSQAKERALELLAMVEMPDPEKAFNSYPHQLSGGQRQRAMIAQSISCDPKLLIADEPTTALDVTVQAEILELMRDLKDRLGSAVLLITHDMGVVADLADRIVVMKEGDIVESGSVADVFSAPQHPYTQALLAAVPRLGEGGGDDASIDLTAALEDAVHEERADGEAPATPPTTGTVGVTVAHRDTPAGARSTEAVLTLENVAIEYGKRGRVAAFRAVDDVSFEIVKGEVLGLVGESGSGKSTIGRAAIGLQPIAEGELTVGGIPLSNADRSQRREAFRKVGIVFQDPSSSLNPRMPIGESIGEPMLLAGVAKGAELDRKVEELLDSVRLPRNYRNRYPYELSGGQKQRVGIARALSLGPELLVADEPTSALDVSVQAIVLDLLKELQEHYRFACLFISHDLAVVDIMADRIAVMHHGRIVELGERDQILRSPQEPYTQRLIAAVPVPDPALQRDRRELRRQVLAETADA